MIRMNEKEQKNDKNLFIYQKWDWNNRPRVKPVTNGNAASSHRWMTLQCFSLFI